MTTTTTAPAALSAPSPSGVIRALGAGSALLVGAHAAIAIMYVPRWPGSLDLVSWSALAVPLAMLALTAAMWLTRAASRALLGLQFATAALVTVVYTLTAVTRDALISGDLELGFTMAALIAQYLVALGVLARGTWRGPQRVLPIAAASWAVVVLPLVLLLGDTEAAWTPFIVYLYAGLIANGLSLAIRPSGGAVEVGA